MLTETPFLSCKEGELFYPYANCGKAQRSRPSGHQVRVDWKRGVQVWNGVSKSSDAAAQYDQVKNFLQKNLSSQH